MSLIRDKAIALISSQRQSIPESLKRAVWRASPLDYFYEPPVAQIFIADDVFDTYLCFNNFYSILVPEAQTPAQGVVQFRDAAGAVFLETRIDLAPHGALALSVRELLQEHGRPVRVGLATADLRPANVAPEHRDLFKQLGRISSHFFTYYLNTQTEAMAIIHPQSTINQAETGREGRGWRSGQTIVTKGLEGVSLYQANHALKEATVTYQLHDVANGEAVARKTQAFPALSANVVSFDMADIQNLPQRLFLTTDRLPAPNGKPLLMRRYPGGRFSMSHS